MRVFLRGLLVAANHRRRKSAGWVSDSVAGFESRVMLSANGVSKVVATAAVPANFGGTWEINGNPSQTLFTLTGREERSGDVCRREHPGSECERLSERRVDDVKVEVSAGAR